MPEPCLRTARRSRRGRPHPRLRAGNRGGARGARANAHAPAPTSARLALSDVELLAPIPHPGTIFAIGLNYARPHRRDGPRRARVADRVRQGRTPRHRPGGPIVCPEVVRAPRLRGRADDRDRADGRAGGYCVADDVSARDLQKREPHWVRAKGSDTLLPVRALDHDRRRDPGSAEPRHAHLGQRRAASGIEHRQPRVRLSTS